MSDDNAPKPPLALVRLRKDGKPYKLTPTPEQKAERERLFECRVEYVADLMRELKFRTGATTKALCDEWDMPRKEVLPIVNEASRRVSAECADADRVMSKVTMALEHVIDSAIESGDKLAVIRAAQTIAHVTGAGAPQKVAVTQEIASLSNEELKARKAALLARIKGEKE